MDLILTFYTHAVITTVYVGYTSIIIMKRKFTSEPLLHVLLIVIGGKMFYVYFNQQKAGIISVIM